MKNLIAATYAPMHPNGTLNLGMIKAYGEFLISNKVTGAFVNGSTGDFVSLSTSERMDLTEAWSDAKEDDIYVINHVGHTNIREAKNLAAHSVGRANAIAALAPYYFKPKSLESLLEYCMEVASAAPDLPFYYYHIPVLTGVNFDIVTFQKKAVSAISNFRGIKFTEDNLTGFASSLDCSNDKVDIFFGVDEKFASSIKVGAKGWVGSTYNHLAPLYYDILAEHEKGSFENAEEMQKLAVYFVNTLEEIGGFHGGSKGFMKFFGLEMGPSRFPHRTFSDEQLNQAMDLMKKESLLDYLSKPLQLSKIPRN
ncbi:dihydrodipicolinate synthase family protein [Cytophaga sp. FL35]|uniref:dihydrodipicolinate synthase family protein n=1 Tax=Cytophaga sp. FL35 TaxID=1904456 RepID=UPI001653A814|nr:dihydrodipicolinate synthase family protein [Cytophaga sp. FL35]MBC7000307.1 dihydrodipicolinate synthase family protein [Cytophaga sp. FL35]